MSEIQVPQGSRWMRPLSLLVLHLLSDYNIIGAENIPAPPYILTANHSSHFDGFAGGTLSYQDIPAFAAKKYQGTFIGFLIKTFAAPVWIEQASPDRQALKIALYTLKAGKPFAIAPEGHRSRDGILREAYEGAAYLIDKAKVPILPVGMVNTHMILKKIRPHVEIRVGRPYRLPETTRATREQLKEFTDRIMCALAALLPEEQHGFYAGHPYIQEMAALVR
ncbi:MAG: 1-acyl-sn-glycerol-3-phosphate acyltransferase [Anaerolineae bacterium]|nr:1-acyl-sn-glycerol-3-phosphate acyltransferase [Anaerolineae bacterium]